MLPFSFQKSIKNASTLRLGGHQFFDRFLHRFLVNFGAVLGPRMAPRSRQDAPKRPQEREKMESFLELFCGCPRGPSWDPLLDRFLIDFGRIFGRFGEDFLDDFGKILGGFRLNWVCFLIAFGCFLCGFFVASKQSKRRAKASNATQGKAKTQLR